MAHIGARIEESARDVNIGRIRTERASLIGSMPVAGREINLPANHRKRITF
jgi:hypothetical protein